jgi:hypothetical protein
MNKLWHTQNKMPPKATLEQRIQWHREHQLHCACREVPKSLLSFMKNIKLRNAESTESEFSLDTIRTVRHTQ